MSIPGRTLSKILTEKMLKIIKDKVENKEGTSRTQRFRSECVGCVDDAWSGWKLTTKNRSIL